MPRASATALTVVDRSQAIGDAVLSVLAQIPPSLYRPVANPAARAELVARTAARKAALAAGGLALPSGPLGWLTVLPELLTVWRLQAQMVADIAALHGQQATLSREQMVYCLFRHTAAQAMRDLLARVGERWLVRAVSTQALQRIAAAIGVSISRRALGAGVARWLPVAGAVGVGAYAYYDTRQVARTAIELFGAQPPASD